MTIATKLRQIMRNAAVTIGFAVATTVGHASLPHTDGDVFIGFHATSGTGQLTDLLINIGPVTNFTGATGSFQVSTLPSNMKANIEATYGVNWHSRADVRWGLIGMRNSAFTHPTNSALNLKARTLIASRKEVLPGIQSVGWDTNSTTTQQTAMNTSVAPMRDKFKDGNGQDPLNPRTDQYESGTQTVIQVANIPGSYASFVPGSTSFSYFTDSPFGIENSFANGAKNSILDLYVIQPYANGGSSSPAPLVGALRINENAEVTFTPNVADFAVPAINFSSAVASVNENAPGGILTLTLTRSVKTDSAVTVMFSTEEVTAFDGVDFTAQLDTPVSFAANEVTKTVDVAILDDSMFTANRTFKGKVTVPNADGIVGDTSEVLVTINETDPPPSTLVLSVAANIAETGGTLPVTITRSGTLTTAVSVTLRTTNGTAIAGTDFTGQSAQVDFLANETTKMLNIPITNRAGYFGDRSFTVALENGTNGATLGTPNSAVVQINETDPQPAILALSAATYNVAEDGGSVAVSINRSGDTSVAVDVTLSTTNGTAASGTDFTAIGANDSQVVSFFAAETAKTVNIAIIDRTAFEGNRAFTVALSNPSGVGQLGTPNSATVNIVETEPNPAGSLAFAAATYKFGTKAVGGLPNTAVATINRTGSVGAVSVQVALSGYAAHTFTSPTTVNFASGETSKDVSVPLTASAGAGSFTLTLSNPTNGAFLGGQTTTVVTIAVPDTKLPVVKITAPKGKVTGSFTVTGDVVEDDALDRVEVTHNGVKAIATLNGKAFSLANLTSENGPNIVTVVAFDIKGTASKPVSVVVTFLDPAVAAKAGIYNGLIIPTGAGSHNTSGAVSNMKVGVTGAFTGKIFLGGFTFSVKGTLSSNGDARFAKDFSETTPLVGKAKPAPIQLGNLALNIAGGKLTGAVGSTSTVDGDKAFYDGKVNIVSVALTLLNKGKFTAAIPSKTVSAAIPQGDGIGFISLTPKGAAKVAGVLADGTKFSAAAPLSQANKMPVYSVLYAKKGSFAGALTFDPAQVNTDVAGTDFLWVRPAQTKVKHYLAGWPAGTKVDVVGAKYVVPAKTENKSVFPFTNGSGDASLKFEDGKLTGIVEKFVTISSANKVTANPNASDKTYKLALKASTGALSGYFPHTDATKTPFRGVVLQKGANKGGFGFFLSNVPKGGAPGLGGGVTILED